MPNNNSFSFKIIRNILYDTVWEGIIAVATLTIRFAQNVTITPLLKATKKALSNISLNIALSFSMLLTGKLYTETISLDNTISILSSKIKETGKLLFSHDFYVTMSFVFNESMRALASIATAVPITANAIVAVFFLLSDYDSGTLGDMEGTGTTLGELFYTT